MIDLITPPLEVAVLKTCLGIRSLSRTGCRLISHASGTWEAMDKSYVLGWEPGWGKSRNAPKWFCISAKYFSETILRDAFNVKTIVYSIKSIAKLNPRRTERYHFRTLLHQQCPSLTAGIVDMWSVHQCGLIPREAESQATNSRLATSDH